MAVWGLDVQQVQQLSVQLNQKAQEIESILQSLTAALNGTQWVGPDATRFRNDWSGAHTSALKQVANALTDASNRAKQNAQQQLNASDS